MDRGPQYICSIRKRVHNTLVNTEKCISSIRKRVHNILVQYRLRSTIYPFNMEKGPQYISSVRKSVHNNISSIREKAHNTLVNTEKCPQYISSIRKRVHNIIISSIWNWVHNTLVQYRKVSTIHYFNMGERSTIY